MNDLTDTGGKDSITHRNISKNNNCLMAYILSSNALKTISLFNRRRTSRECVYLVTLVYPVFAPVTLTFTR